MHIRFSLNMFFSFTAFARGSVTFHCTSSPKLRCKYQPNVFSNVTLVRFSHSLNNKPSIFFKLSPIITSESD